MTRKPAPVVEAKPTPPTSDEVMAVYVEEGAAFAAVEGAIAFLDAAKQRLERAQGARIAMLRRHDKGAS